MGTMGVVKGDTRSLDYGSSMLQLTTDAITSLARHGLKNFFSWGIARYGLKYLFPGEYC